METNLFLLLIIIWIVIGAIIGSFGTNRKIGFTGTFFASLLLSPLFAMLFVLASDKTGNKKLSRGETALFITPIVILIAIIINNIHQDNILYRQNNAYLIREEIAELNSVNFFDLPNVWSGTGKEWGIYKSPNYSGYDNFNYWNLRFTNENEFKTFKTNRINTLQTSLKYYLK
jgi:hypothetical protein